MFHNYERYIRQRGRCASMWTSGVRHAVNERHETAVIGASSPKVCFNYVRSIRQRGRCASMWTSGARHTVNEWHETALIGALDHHKPPTSDCGRHISSIKRHGSGNGLYDTHCCIRPALICICVQSNYKGTNYKEHA